MLVDEMVAEAVGRWRELPGPHWLEPRYCPCGAALEWTSARLRREIVERLARADQRCRAQARVEAGSLRTWPSSQGLILDFDSGNAGRQRWHFPRQRGGGRLVRRRGRVGLPACTPYGHLRAGGAEAACLVSGDPMLAEWCRAAWARVGGNGLWQTGSVRRARRWLLTHAQCPLIFMDGADGWWCFDPRRLSPAGTGACTPRPEQSGEVLRQVRKIFE